MCFATRRKFFGESEVWRTIKFLVESAKNDSSSHLWTHGEICELFRFQNVSFRRKNERNLLHENYFAKKRIFWIDYERTFSDSRDQVLTRESRDLTVPVSCNGAESVSDSRITEDITVVTIECDSEGRYRRRDVSLGSA